MSERVLYIDCVGGVAGDMLLSALVEAADCAEAVDRLPAALGFDDVTLEWRQARPGGFAARQLEVRFDPGAHPRHRGLAEIEALVARAGVSETARERALRVFRRLAEAEATVHGVALEQVHLHEVGAVDAVIDILGVAVAMDVLDPAIVVCSPLPMGTGTVRCEHGVLPLPAPAVAAMLPGVPVRPAGIEGETVTPTGAALVTVLAHRFGPMPAMTVHRVGIGSGSREHPALPNLVRVFDGTTAAASDHEPRHDENLVVECNVDDMDPRLLPPLIDSLLAAGALDSFITPIVMKKGRPAHLVTVLTTTDRAAAIRRTLFTETTTLGCRSHPVAKHSLARRMETVNTRWGPVPVKVALLDRTALRSMPEFEACAALARQAGVSIRQVMAAASHAADDQDQGER